MNGIEDTTDGKTKERTGTYMGGVVTMAGENGKTKIGFGVSIIDK